ncbi:hypothetical protein R0K17_05270 [Planococcus sp. SIMBA_143]
MKKEIKDLLPNWVNEKQDRTLTLTNDLDSLISCSLLKHLFGYEINHFYTFSRFATLNQSDTRKSIGVDMALTRGYCYDNHLNMLTSASYKNPDSANINTALNLSRENYSHKFSMSTLIFLWSLYDVPMTITEDGKKILLAIDSGFKGWYPEPYRHILENTLDMLEMTELIEVMERTPIGDMYDFISKHELDSSIRLRQSGKHDGKLIIDPSGRNINPFLYGLDLEWLSEQLGFPIELPTEKFTTVQKLSNKELEWHELDQKTIDGSFSYAFTYKNKIKLSKMKVEGESA